MTCNRQVPIYFFRRLFRNCLVRILADLLKSAGSDWTTVVSILMLGEIQAAFCNHQYCALTNISVLQV